MTPGVDHRHSAQQHDLEKPRTRRRHAMRQHVVERPERLGMAGQEFGQHDHVGTLASDPRLNGGDVRVAPAQVHGDDAQVAVARRRRVRPGGSDIG